MKTIVLRRLEDESGVSGTGIVAQGCVFDNGFVALTWLTHLSSLVWYHSIEVLLSVHGHGGKTVVEYENLVPAPTPNAKKSRKKP
jgi:hypothetical protein